MSVNELFVSVEMGLIYAIVAIGIYITFRLINVSDLSCDGSFVLGSAVSCILIQLGYCPWISLIAASFAGALAGSVTGLLMAYLGMSDLLASILVAFMLYSVNLRVLGGVPNISLMDLPTIFSQNHTLITLLAMVGVIIFALSFFCLSDRGLALRSIGQNRRLAQNMGIRLNPYMIAGIALSNAFIGLAGGVGSQYQGFVDVNSGIGTLIVGLASVMIGERLLPYRSIFFKIISCVIGSVVYRLVLRIALHSDSLGLQTQDMNLVTGIIVISIILCSKRKNDAHSS
jgi:putative ABC transport system permease protein